MRSSWSGSGASRMIRRRISKAVKRTGTGGLVVSMSAPSLGVGRLRRLAEAGGGERAALAGGGRVAARQECARELGEGDVAIPAVKGADLVVGHAAGALRELDRLFHPPARPGTTAGVVTVSVLVGGSG